MKLKVRPIIGITTSMDEAKRPSYSLPVPYIDAISSAGGLGVMIPTTTETQDLDELCAGIDGLLLPGGVDVDPIHYGEEPDRAIGTIDPIADRFELAICRHFLKRGKPILGICRGIQVLNVAAGGDLVQDIVSQTRSRLLHSQKAPGYYPTHIVDIVSGSRLASITGCQTMRVNTFHHQAVRRVASGFIVSARSSDGLVEAIERVADPMVLGVQWHPERMTGDSQAASIFQAFVSSCRTTATGR